MFLVNINSRWATLCNVFWTNFSLKTATLTERLQITFYVKEVNSKVLYYNINTEEVHMKTWMWIDLIMEISKYCTIWDKMDGTRYPLKNVGKFLTSHCMLQEFKAKIMPQDTNGVQWKRIVICHFIFRRIIATRI